MVSRRAVIGGAGAAVLAGLGYRAWDRGVFSAGEGEAFAPWIEWQGQNGEGLRRPLHAGILAANPHNTQPWLFSADGDTITVWADRGRNLGTFDPYRREMYLGLGCAIANIQTAAYLFDFIGQDALATGKLALSQPDTPIEVARIGLRRSSTLRDEAYTGIPALRDMASAIGNRHTNRGAYLPEKTPPAEFLREWGKRGSGDTRIVFFTDKSARADMGGIIVKATEAIIADPQMSADSARWFRTGRREILAHRDGVTMDTAGLSPLMRAAVKIAPDVGASTADQSWLSMTRDIQAATAPVFGMLLVRDRLDIAQALSAGRAWQQLHLSATVKGLAAQPMNQPVEMMDRNLMLGRKDEFGPALAKLHKMGGWEPTFVFRMGYAESDALPSPRRPLSDVLRP